MKNSILLLLSIMGFTIVHAQPTPPSLLATYANYLANASEENISETYWQYFSKEALTGIEVSSPTTKGVDKSLCFFVPGIIQAKKHINGVQRLEQSSSLFF